MTSPHANPNAPGLEHKGMIEHLTPAQWAAIAPLFCDQREYGPDDVISHRGDTLEYSLLLLDGVIARSIPKPGHDKSTFVALQFKGDFVDLHAFPLKQLDHDVVSLTASKVAVIMHDTLRAFLNDKIELLRILWSLTLVDASIHRQWAMRNSSLRGFARVANLFSEIDARLCAATGKQSDDYVVGLSQIDIADATGLTPVHVNRVLKDLREDGCCAISGGRLSILDRKKMHARGNFDPAYLYLPHSDASL